MLYSYFVGRQHCSHLGQSKRTRCNAVRPFAGKSLFASPHVLPKFTLKTVKAVQTIANAPKPHANWSMSLQSMEQLLDEAAPFDLALLGCGSYGLPLMARIWGRHARIER